MKQFGVTRPDATTGARPSHPAYRGAGTQKTNPHAEIIRFPSGSLLRPEASFEPLDLPKARFNEALALALGVNFLCWFGFALILRALFF